jgi:hypothetical protein
MRNWLCGLQWGIICQQYPYCQIKLWACSWLYFSPFSVSMSLEFPCTPRVFFSEHLPNHYQGPRLTFSQICTKFDDVPLSDPAENRIRSDTQLHIRGRNKSAHPLSCVKCCALPPKISTAASLYYNCCSDGSASPGNYGPLHEFE